MERLDGKGLKGGSIEDDKLSFARARLGQLMHKSEANTLTPDEDEEMTNLIKYGGKTLGLPGRSAKPAPVAPPAAKAPGLMERAKKFLGGVGRGASGTTKPAGDDAKEVRRRLGLK